MCKFWDPRTGREAEVGSSGHGGDPDLGVRSRVCGTTHMSRIGSSGSQGHTRFYAPNAEAGVASAAINSGPVTRGARLTRR